MKKFKEYLEEVFNAPYQWKKNSGNSHDAYIYSINTKDGEYTILIKTEDGNPPGIFHITFHKGPYSQRNYKSYDILTGANDIRIYSTLIDIIDDFIKTNAPMKLWMIGTSSKRSQLYHRIAKKLAPRLSDEYIIKLGPNSLRIQRNNS